MTTIINNPRETWNAQNNTANKIVIGDLPQLPSFMPGDVHNLLRYATKEEIQLSQNFINLVKNSRITLTKTTEGNSDRIPPERVKISINSAEENQYMEDCGEMWLHVDASGGQLVSTSSGNLTVIPMDLPGDNSAFTFTTGVLTCIVSGRYKIDYALSFANNTNGQTGSLDFAVERNGNTEYPTELFKLHSHRSVSATTGIVGNTGGTGIVTIAAGETIKLMAHDEDGNVDIRVRTCSINLTRRQIPPP